MATRKTVDQILDKAADILEKDGWVTEVCYDSRTGGYCALGAIARAVYPKLPKSKLEDVAYVGNQDVDPTHREAVEFLARRIDRDVYDPADTVYEYNDGLPKGFLGSYYDHKKDEFVFEYDEKVRLKSSRKVVKKLRDAAKAYRKKAA